MTSFYLKHARIDHFGAIDNRVVGPLSPHLNVVYGSNEAGKTTLASFVGGVLFGWEDARSSRNTYRPQGSERAGSLFFEERSDVADSVPDATGDLVELRRERNADGLQGNVHLLDDIDKDTFRTVFFLTSDELRSLRNTSDMTARLLTAGSGTGRSPAQVLGELRARADEYTSRSAKIHHSIVRLAEEREEVRQSLRVASEEMERYRRQDEELHDIEPKRQEARLRVEELNTQIGALSTCRTSIEKLHAEEASLKTELEHLHNDERRAVASRRSREQVVGRKLANITGAEDRAMRERLDDLSQRKVKQAHVLEAARDDAREARAAYEAVCAAQSQLEQGRAHVGRGMQIAVTAAMFALLLLCGVPLFVQGRSAGSLTYMSLGLVMILFGLLLAAAALVLLFRPTRRDEERQDRVESAREVMLQCEKRAEIADVEFQTLREEIAADLESMGLGAAQTSISRARVLLDDARDARSEIALDRQRQQAATMRVDEVEASLSDIAAQRAHLCERAGVDASISLADLDREIALRTSERAELQERTEALSRRAGELTQELSQARHAREFDKLKTRLCELKTRIDEASTDLARLLLAQRMLEEAIETWNERSQPEVYAQASRLMLLMTGGKWTRVALSESGELRVTDATLTTREPGVLSLGTCQQLYLALRIALLMCADDVGRSIPILADDILVNFDEQRRAGAARALVELSQKRQVIVFTCHREVVDALCQASDAAAGDNTAQAAGEGERNVAAVVENASGTATDDTAGDGALRSAHANVIEL